MGEKELSERVDALESRLAYQDQTIEQLNETITAQWKQIDTLTRQLTGLNERLQEQQKPAVFGQETRPVVLVGELPAFVVDALLEQRRAKPLHHPATNLLVNQLRIDDGPAILDHPMLEQLDEAGFGIDLQP